MPTGKSIPRPWGLEKRGKPGRLPSCSGGEGSVAYGRSYPAHTVCRFANGTRNVPDTWSRMQKMPLEDIDLETHRLGTAARSTRARTRVPPLPRPAVINSEVVFSEDVPLPAARSRRPFSRAQRILFPLLALTLAVVAACGIAELGLRVFAVTGGTTPTPWARSSSPTTSWAATASRTSSAASAAWSSTPWSSTMRTASAARGHRRAGPA